MLEGDGPSCDEFFACRLLLGQKEQRGVTMLARHGFPLHNMKWTGLPHLLYASVQGEIYNRGDFSPSIANQMQGWYLTIDFLRRLYLETGVLVRFAVGRSKQGNMLELESEAANHGEFFYLPLKVGICPLFVNPPGFQFQEDLIAMRVFIAASSGFPHV